MNPSGVEREHMSKLFPGKHPSHKHGSSKHSSSTSSSNPSASPAGSGKKQSSSSSSGVSSSTNSISSKKQPPSVDVVRKNLNFSRPPGAGSGGGGDILGSIMMGMQNNMQKKDWAIQKFCWWLRNYPYKSRLFIYKLSWNNFFSKKTFDNNTALEGFNNLKFY